MLRLLILIVAVCVAVHPMRSGQLVPHGRVEKLPHRVLGYAPMPRFQAGHVFSRDRSMSSIWIDSVDEHGGEPVNHAIKLPDSIRLSVGDIAVSYDGSIAVCSEAVDRDGHLASLIAWVEPGGPPTRIVRTSPFAPTGIGFTADGSLWAAGIEKVNRSDAHPSHDVVRQYDPEGRLVRSLLSRAEFSDDHWHPAYASLLVTSRHYVAFVSREAGTWTLISSAGVVVGNGAIGVGGKFQVVTAAVTDSGRIFVSVHRAADKHLTLFEVGNDPVRIDSIGFLAPEHFGPVVGSDGESLVFLSNQNHDFVWANLE